MKFGCMIFDTSFVCRYILHIDINVFYLRIKNMYAPLIDVQKCDVYHMIMNCTNKSANSCCCRLNCQSSM